MKILNDLQKGRGHVLTEKVTVVIPVYNREKYIEKAISSVQNQSVRDWRLLIIDDASTDRTVETIKPFLADNRIELIQMDKNQGTGKSLNFALTQIKTPYFMTLDSDDWIEGDTLERLLCEMEKQPESTVLIYGNVLWWKEHGEELLKIKEEVHRPFQDKYDFILYGPIPNPRFYRTSSVKQVNGFEIEEISEGRFAEDRNLLLKLITIGHFHHLNDYFYHYRFHDQNTSAHHQKELNQVKKYLYEKYLKEWGNEYQPIYYISENGWLDIKEIVSTKKRSYVDL